MKDETMVYEPPALVEVGDFAELTQMADIGATIDNPWFQDWWEG